MQLGRACVLFQSLCKGVVMLWGGRQEKHAHEGKEIDEEGKRKR